MDGGSEVCSLWLLCCGTRLVERRQVEIVGEYVCCFAGFLASGIKHVSPGNVTPVFEHGQDLGMVTVPKNDGSLPLVCSGLTGGRSG